MKVVFADGNPNALAALRTTNRRKSQRTKHASTGTGAKVGQRNRSSP